MSDPYVVVIGGANLDVKARSTRTVVPATSNPGTTTMSAGGVGRNIAENLARLGTRTHLVASIGADAPGAQVLAATAAAGVGVEQVRRSAASTGNYTAVLDADGELVVAVADMAATDDLTPDRVREAQHLIASAALVVLDGNLATATLASALEITADAGVRAVFEPVSVPKAAALAGLITAERPLFAVTPNCDELGALTGLPTGTDDEVDGAIRLLHERGVELVWVRLGRRGSLLSSARSQDRVTLPAVPAEVVDVTGAGDAMLAAFCHALLAGSDPAGAAALGHAAAALTVADVHTVRPDLTDRLVRSHVR